MSRVGRPQQTPISDDWIASPSLPIASISRRWKRIGTTRTFQYIGMRNAELNRIAFVTDPVVVRKPFLFWPLVKLCLAAKRGHHRHNGESRAIERKAFEAELAHAILHRAGKQGERSLIDRFDYQALGDSVAGSELCRRGVVDLGKLQKVLDEPISEDAAFVLIRAASIVDWIALHEGTR